MRMKRQREAVQRNFPNSRSRVHLAKLLAITVFQVREANRYSGLRSLHVVHGDEASAFIIALFPSKALHCRESRARCPLREGLLHEPARPASCTLYFPRFSSLHT